MPKSRLRVALGEFSISGIAGHINLDICITVDILHSEYRFGGKRGLQEFERPLLWSSPEKRYVLLGEVM